MAHDLKSGSASYAETYGLSPMQEGMLLESLSAPGTGLDITQVICALPEAIEPGAMEVAWQQVVDRHAALRATFPSSMSAEPIQTVRDKAVVPFTFHDWRNRRNAGEPLKELLRDQRSTEFKLSEAPLMRVALVQLGEKNHQLIWTFHHLLIDARSIALVLKEVFTLYDAQVTGDAAGLPEPRPYRAFIDWLQQTEQATAEAFWREHLKGFSTPTPLPLLRPKGATAVLANAETETLLPAELTERVRASAQENGVTFNTIIQGAWALLLSRYSAEEDVVFGAVRAGRRGTVEGAEEMVGVFINTVPVRSRISPDLRLSDWLKNLREQWIAMRPFEHTPLGKVQAWSEVASGRRLFETVLNVQDPSWDDALKAQGGRWAERDFRIINQPSFALALDVYVSKETVLKLVYDPGQFDTVFCDRMLGHLRTLLSAMADDPTQIISNLPLLTREEEEQLLVEWNRTAVEVPNVCVHEMVEKQATERPEAVAVVCEECALTYADLNARASALARKLQDSGVGPEVLVAVIMERSPEMIIGALAVLKAGGAYVPIDPAYPQERIAYMLEETAAPVVLTQTHLASKLPKTTAQTICVGAEPLLSPGEERPAPNAATRATPANLAYVIYTSGSTGKPKGVEIQHCGLMNLVCWHQRVYDVKPGDRATQLASPAFDAAVWEIWPYLASGGAIYIPSEETRLSPSKLVQWLAAKEIHFCFMPTPLAEEALNESWPQGIALKVLLTGGDKLRRYPPRGTPFKVVNHYGPTENSVVTTAGEVAPKTEMHGAPPIGRPIDNTRVYILDPYLRPAPVGIAGELYVAGVGLARGYLKQPELTAERFVANPFEGQSRLYRTGDMVRYLADGSIEFLGRADQQVKIRGYRIEIGEVEICLNRHPAVKQCAVVAREAAGQTQLVAYVVGSERTEELREFLAKSLPEYMIPAAFVWLDHLPLTTNGKVDRAALPCPELEKRSANGSRTATEEIVAGIWRDVLGKSELDVERSFFEIGGHSLLAARVSARIAKTFGFELPLDEFFRAPTVAGIAKRIDQRQEVEKTATVPIRTRSDQSQPVLSFAQERLWFMERLQPGLPVNNVPLAVRIKGSLNVDALREAIKRVVARHEVLHTSFRSTQGRPSAELQSGEPAFEIVDLSVFTPAERETESGRITREEAARPFDLEHAPLLRTKLLRLGNDEHLLLLTTHHIVSDGWSVGIFYNELAEIYRAICQGQSEELKPLGLTYSDYAAWQREWLQGAILEKQVSYWQEELKGAPTVLELPADRPRPAVQSYRGATKLFALPNALASNLRGLAQSEDVTLFMLLLAAFQSLLHRYSGQDDLLVGSPMAGRKRVETEGLIGLFLNNVVYRAKFRRGVTFRELLQETRRTALAAHAHQDLPFEKLVEAMQVERDLSRSPIFQVMFVLQNTPLQPLELAGLTLKPLPVHSGTAKYDLTLGLEEEGAGLTGYLEYSTDLFDESTIVRLLGHFQTLLESAVANPDQPIAKIPILTPAEQQQVLVEWNATTAEYPDKCIHELIEAQVEETPHNIALVFEEEELSYGDLNVRANRLAHHLRSLGVRPEVRVAICLQRSIEMMIALLAVHKAGGAYVPLDPAYPTERLTFMLQDSGSTVLVTQGSLLTKLPFSPEKTIDLDTFGLEQSTPERDANPETGVTTENVAYVIYTSGSTGQPKGVTVLHRNVANFFTGMDARIGTERGVWLAVTSISFDISVLELFWTLSRGFKVVIQSDESAFRAGPAHTQPARSSARKMDFSLFYFASDAGSGRDQYRLLIDGAKFADEHGFTAVWTPERHFHQFGGLFPNPSVTSAAIAMVTNRVQLRAGSVVLPLHHPVRVAEEWSVVDNLSNGRAAISFASGWHANDFVFAPANYIARRQLMYRDIDLFRKLWRGETVVMPGGSGENVNVRIFPQPVQRELPAWMTSSGDPETFRTAGELGLNVLTHLSGQSMEQLAEKIAVYRKAWKSGRNGSRGHVSLMLHTFVWTDMDAAWKKVRKPLWDYLKNYRDLSKNESNRGPKVSGDIEALLNEAVNRYFGMTGLFGPPEHCCKTVDKMRDLGVDEIACLIDFGVEIDSVLASLRHLQSVKEKSNRTVFTGARSYSIPEQIERHGVTHFQCTPSLLSMLVEDANAVPALKQLKKVTVGGEAFPPTLAQRLEGGPDILNMYGPTETTIWSTTQRIERGVSVTIGRPIANTQIYIVDREQQPVPVNVPGELLIGGAGVARGYLNRPDLTKERFIANPFNSADGSRLYRTGDLARYLSNGEIEFLGRTDHQVKLRGFRIELGEIEAALRQHPAIRECAVAVREVGANDKRLFAYVSTQSSHRPSVIDLKRFLKERLPDYMVPSNVVFLEALPLTPNGKIDRKALPTPEVRRIESEPGFVAAKTDVERSIARIWEQVLHLERIGLNENFFELGGHSLLAAQVQASLAEALQIELPIIKLFQYPTVSALAGYLREERKERVSFQKVQERARRQREAFAWRNQPQVAP